MPKITFSQRPAFELGLSKMYKDEAKLLPLQYKGWLREETADTWFHESAEVSGVGVMPPKALDDSISTDTIYEGDVVTRQLSTYAIALIISYETIRWDLYGVFPKLMKSLAKSAVDRKNLTVYALVNDWFNGSTYTDLQGEALFGEAKARLDGGTWSNSGTEPLSYVGIQQAMIDLKFQVNERGRYITANPTAMICAVELDWIAQTILQSTLRPGTGDNDANLLKGSGVKGPHCSPFITQSTYWGLWDKSCDVFFRIGDEPDLLFDGDPRSRDRVATSYMSNNLVADKARGCWASTGGA